MVYFNINGSLEGELSVGDELSIESRFIQWQDDEGPLWHHYAFVKDGDLKQIWIDGELLHDGVNTEPLP